MTGVRIQVWREHDEWVAWAYACRVHAFGATAAEVLANLRLEMDSQYRLLVGLGPSRVSPALYATTEPLRQALGLTEAKAEGGDSG